ncbi:MAG: cytidine deaminase [Clostridia bacterium]|nr:cytidine deaminase [Clostridia bacterium]
MTDAELFRISVEAAKNAYAPYSNFHVGAALLAKDGRVFTGCNIENSSFGATICAERTAMSKAISEGCREFVSIAISGNGGTSWPCGICRQFMFEFADDLRIISGENENELKVYDIKELLLEGFRL